MASKEAIGRRNEAATKRLQAAMGIVADRLGVDAVALPSHSRDAALLPVLRLEVLADWAESVAQAAPEKAATVPEDGGVDTGKADADVTVKDAPGEGESEDEPKADTPKPLVADSPVATEAIEDKPALDTPKKAPKKRPKRPEKPTVKGED